MDQMSFGGGGGAVLIEKLLDVAPVGFGVLGGQDGGLGGQAVAQCVVGGTLFAGCGARAGGVEGVGAVGGGAAARCASEAAACNEGAAGSNFAVFGCGRPRFGGLASGRQNPLLLVLLGLELLLPFRAPRLTG